MFLFWSFIGWATPVTSPNTISTPNLPTSTPVHQAYCSSAAPRPSAGIPSETSLTSGSLLNGSSNQLAKAEEKIQGRGMSRSHASYGIQQLLQEQVLIIFTKGVWSILLFNGKWRLIRGRKCSIMTQNSAKYWESFKAKLSLYVNFSHILLSFKSSYLCITQWFFGHCAML